VNAPAAAELASGPVLERIAREPSVLISLGKRGDFGMMAETERLPATARRDTGGNPGIVSQGLVIQVRSLEDSRVSASAIPNAPEMKPVADPPGGRVGHDCDPVTETHPVIERELAVHIQRVPGEPPAATVRQRVPDAGWRILEAPEGGVRPCAHGVRIVTAAGRARICGSTGPAWPGQERLLVRIPGVPPAGQGLAAGGSKRSAMGPTGQTAAAGRLGRQS